MSYYYFNLNDRTSYQHFYQLQKRTALRKPTFYSSQNAIRFVQILAMAWKPHRRLLFIDTGSEFIWKRVMSASHAPLQDFHAQTQIRKLSLIKQNHIHTQFRAVPWSTILDSKHE